MLQEAYGADLRNVTVLFVNLGLKEVDMLAANTYDEAMIRMHKTLQVRLRFSGPRFNSSQRPTQAVQGAVYQYEGSVNKFRTFVCKHMYRFAETLSMFAVCDDKGSTLIAVFGLPPLSHEDDTTRGVLCGLAICERLWAQGLIASVGITTGVVFCGVVGSTTRKEYTVLGDTVNLSARLMQVDQVLLITAHMF